MRSTDSSKRNLKRNTENMFPSPKEVWYERVVVRGEKGRKKWDIAGKVHGDDPYAHVT